MYTTKTFTGEGAREERDARYAALKTKGTRHLVKGTDQIQEQVRLRNGKMVDGEMVYVVRFPGGN